MRIRVNIQYKRANAIQEMVWCKQPRKGDKVKQATIVEYKLLHVQIVFREILDSKIRVHACTATLEKNYTYSNTQTLLNCLDSKSRLRVQLAIRPSSPVVNNEMKDMGGAEDRRHCCALDGRAWDRAIRVCWQWLRNADDMYSYLKVISTW